MYNKKVLFYPKGSGIVKQYKNAKYFLEVQYYSKVSFKERQHKGVGI
jgi:hypothetical protein